MNLRVVLLSGAAVAALGSAAQAQSIDYGRTERFFGEPVTASATGSPQKVTDAPVNMEIISADDIRRSGADNIPDLLAFVAGLDVRRYGFGHAEVSMRGYNQQFSPRLLVLINGRQAYDDTYGYTVWDSLPVQLDEIRQIEVIKGPNSALFGFNAVGGVINIITYDPLLDSKSAVTARGGTQGDVEGSAVATAHFGGDAGLRLSAADSRADGFSENSTGVTQFRNSFSMDGRAKLAPTVEATLEATDTHARYADLPSAYGVAAASYDTNSFKGGIAAGTSLGLLNLVTYRNEVNISSAGRKLSNDVYVVQANDQFKFGSDHTFRFGLEFRDNSAHSVEVFGGDVGYYDYAASGMWNWQLTPTLALTNSIRVDYLTLNYSGTLASTNARYTQADYNDTSVTAPSFNSGLVYKVSGDDTIRMTVARGIQAPSLIDFGMQALVPMGEQSVAFIGNPNVKPSAVMNYEVDYDSKIALIGSTLRVAVYHQKTDDMINAPINLVMPTQSGANYCANIGSSSALGGEVGLRGVEGNLRWNTSYSVETISDHFNSAGGSGEGVGPLNFDHGTPTHRVSAGIGYSWGKFELDAQGRWQSTYTDYNTYLQPVHISDYITANARLGYNITDDLILAVSGQQLNQTRLVETAGSPVERRVIGSATVKF